MSLFDPVEMSTRIDRLKAASAERGDARPAVCPACGGTGWQPSATDPDRVQRCLCWRAKYTGIASVAACGVGERDAGFTFDSYRKKFATSPDAVKCLTWAELWIRTDLARRSDIILVGPNGTGKTGLAIAMLRAVIDAGSTARFTEVDALARRWRATFARKRTSDNDLIGESDQDIVDELIGLDLLVLDEFAGTVSTEFIGDAVRSIVVGRQRRERPTILTLNVKADAQDDATVEADLARLLGPTLFDKLRERAQFFFLFGPSARAAYQG